MAPLRRQYTIDDDLGRYAKALLHLHSLGAFDELKIYVERHELYTAALDLYRYEPDRLKAIMRSYADFLSSRSRFKEAGIGQSKAYVILRTPLTVFSVRVPHRLRIGNRSIPSCEPLARVSILGNVGSASTNRGLVARLCPSRRSD